MGGRAVSLVEARRLSTLPLPQIRKELVTRQLKLGGPLTQAECDTGMAMLAAAGLPRASTGGQGGVVRALYLELLREAGVTGEMFIAACKRIIMAEPLPGKTKFFPDPGQIAAVCREDAEDRRRQLEALNGAVALLEAPAPAAQSEAPLPPEEIDRRRAMLRSFVVGEPVSKGSPSSAPARNTPRATAGAILESRDPAAVEHLRNMNRTKEQA
jgi:hypothetical protein